MKTQHPGQLAEHTGADGKLEERVGMGISQCSGRMGVAVDLGDVSCKGVCISHVL